MQSNKSPSVQYATRMNPLIMDFGKKHSFNELDYSKLNIYDVFKIENKKLFKVQKGEMYPSIKPPVSQCSQERSRFLFSSSMQALGCGNLNLQLLQEPIRKSMDKSVICTEPPVVCKRKIQTKKSLWLQKNVKQFDWDRLTQKQLIRMLNCKHFAFRDCESYSSTRPPISPCSAEQTAEWAINALENSGCQCLDEDITDAMDIWKNIPKKETLIYYGVENAGKETPEALAYKHVVSKSLLKAGVRDNNINANLTNKKTEQRSVKRKNKQNTILNQTLLTTKVAKMDNIQQILRPSNCPIVKIKPIQTASSKQVNNDYKTVPNYYEELYNELITCFKPLSQTDLLLDTYSQICVSKGGSKGRSKGSSKGSSKDHSKERSKGRSKRDNDAKRKDKSAIGTGDQEMVEDQEAGVYGSDIDSFDSIDLSKTEDGESSENRTNAVDNKDLTKTVYGESSKKDTKVGFDNKDLTKTVYGDSSKKDTKGGFDNKDLTKTENGESSKNDTNGGIAHIDLTKTVYGDSSKNDRKRGVVDGSEKKTKKSVKIRTNARVSGGPSKKLKFDAGFSDSEDEKGYHGGGKMADLLNRNDAKLSEGNDSKPNDGQDSKLKNKKMIKKTDKSDNKIQGGKSYKGRYGIKIKTKDEIKESIDSNDEIEESIDKPEKDCVCNICKFLNRKKYEVDPPFITEMLKEQKRQELLQYCTQKCLQENLIDSRPGHLTWLRHKAELCSDMKSNIHTPVKTQMSQILNLQKVFNILTEEFVDRGELSMVKKLISRLSWRLCTSINGVFS